MYLLQWEHNIQSVFAHAKQTPLYKEGKLWYARAWALANQLDPQNPWRVVDAIAVLSPRVSWEWNVELAKRWVRGEPVPTTQVNLRKLALIQRGHKDVVRGPKVQAFAHCIRMEGKTKTVCLDRHALSIALGRRPTLQETHRLSSIEFYRCLSGAYQLVAEQHRLWPAQLQAITWCFWRANGRNAQLYLPFSTKGVRNVTSRLSSVRPRA